jgi:hypothetical protein
MAPILLHDHLHIAQLKRMSFSRFEDLSVHTSLLCGCPCSSQPRYSSAGRSSPSGCKSHARSAVQDTLLLFWGQKAPAFRHEDEWPCSFAGYARLCQNRSVAPCQLNRVWAFRGQAFPRVKARTYFGRGAPRRRDVQLAGTSIPHKHLLTAEGLAAVVTAAVPPECASA